MNSSNIEAVQGRPAKEGSFGFTLIECNDFLQNEANEEAEWVETPKRHELHEFTRILTGGCGGSGGGKLKC